MRGETQAESGAEMKGAHEEVAGQQLQEELGFALLHRFDDELVVVRRVEHAARRAGCAQLVQLAQAHRVLHTQTARTTDTSRGNISY